MSADSDHGTTRISGTTILPARPLRVEKPHETSTSGDPDRDRSERRGPKPTRRQAYHFDTVPVSLWNAPLLTSPYAAQVIAQALYAPETRTSAYPKPAAPTALFLDCRL